MSNGIPQPAQSETPVNGMTGLLAKIAQGTAVGGITVMLFVDVIYLGPQREQRAMQMFQQQQEQADARYDRLLSEIVTNQNIARQNKQALQKIDAKTPP